MLTELCFSNLMARNEEKHYGKLNRLYLLKEKEEYERKNPKRPKLDSLVTVEEIQKWLPSIKKDIDFYLKKSQVTCYSDAHVDECREQVVKFEKEFKAFVRKLKNLSPYPVETTPWTSRAYERKKTETLLEDLSSEFRPIPTPILDVKNKTDSQMALLHQNEINLPLNDQPLIFSKNVNSDSCVTIFEDVNNELPLKDVPLIFSNNVEINSCSPTLKGVNNNLPVNGAPLLFSNNRKTDSHVSTVKCMNNDSPSNRTTSASYPANKVVESDLPSKSKNNVDGGTLLSSSVNTTSLSCDSMNDKNNKVQQVINIVNYDSSDSET